MPISDGQIALGILQLVALALPVFALLADVYFTVTDMEYNPHLAFALFAGGTLLVLGAISSAQYLSAQSGSILVQFSIVVISMGLVPLVYILYLVYEQEKKGLEKAMRDRLDSAERIIDGMKEYDVNTLDQLKDTDFEFQESSDEEVTLEDMKAIRNGSRSFRNFIKDQYAAIPKIIIAIVILAAAVTSTILNLSPIPVMSPFGIAASIITITALFGILLKYWG